MQKRFKVLSEKELVKNMMYLVWESNPRLSVHEADTLPSELTRFTSAKSGSNRRPSELQSDALPTELLAEPIEHEHKNIIYSNMTKFLKLWNKESMTYACTNLN